MGKTICLLLLLVLLICLLMWLFGTLIYAYKEAMNEIKEAEEYGKLSDNYVSGSVDSDKCTLHFLGHKIEVIQLTDALYKKAQKSEIEKYLNNKKQIVVEDKDASHRALGGVSMLGSVLNTSAGSLLLQNAQKYGYPTREKCLIIMDWLCEVE